MSRNVEIKAKVNDLDGLLSKVKDITKSEGEILAQEDTFFNVQEGRLKLRDFHQNNQTSQLIFYNRLDTEGPKLSTYSISPVTNSKELTSVLSLALGIKGKVKKTRHLFLYGQTRIHIDQVEGLGDYMELEVVLTPEQTLQEGQIIADNLMNKLNITAENLISGAYLDQKN